MPTKEEGKPGSAAVVAGTGTAQAGKEATAGREKQAEAAAKAAPVGAAASAQAKHLQGQGVAPGTSTAAAKAAAGSPAGEETAGKGPEVSDGSPIGAQLEPAIMTASGSIPHGHVASPSGLVPASAAGGAEALAAYGKRLEDEAKGRTRQGTRLTDEHINRLNKPELRAAAADRGYDIGQAGTRVMADRFRKAQAEDASLTDAQAED